MLCCLETLFGTLEQTTAGAARHYARLRTARRPLSLPVLHPAPATAPAGALCCLISGRLGRLRLTCALEAVLWRLPPGREPRLQPALPLPPALSSAEHRLTGFSA